MEATTSDKEVNGSNIAVCVSSKPRYYHGLRALSCLLECLGIEALKPDLEDSSSSSSSSSGDDTQPGEGVDPPAPTLEPSPSPSPPSPTEDSAVVPAGGKRPRPPPVITGPPQTNNLNS